MPTNKNRSSNRGGNNRRGEGRGRGRGSSAGILDVAREAPLATAAAAAGAVAAGVFLWSKRAQITDQINEWTDSLTTAGNEDELEFAGGGTASARNRQIGMSETGGGNASVGARSGGGGISSTASGRGRASSTTPRATRG
jgi:hypothetical protein